MEWCGRDVLITGAAGFVGRRLASQLRARGAFVRAVDLVSRPGVDALDVRDQGAVRAAVLPRAVVFHLASVVGVVHVLRRPRECYETSVLGTRNVVTAAEQQGATVIFTSSSEVYGEGEGRILHEALELPLEYGAWPRASYPAGKRAAEQLVLEFASRGGDGRVARLFNVSGPGQDPGSGMVLPTLVQQALRGEEMSLVHGGEDVRCFQHVDDAALGLLRLAEAEELNERVFNLGGERPLSMRELAAEVSRELGVPERLRFVDSRWRYGPGATRCRVRVPSVARARADLRHSAVLGVDRIIRDLAAQITCAESSAARA